MQNGKQSAPPPMIQIVVQPNGVPMVQSNCLDPLATATILGQAIVVWSQHMMVQRQKSVVLADGSAPPEAIPAPQEFVPSSIEE